MLGPSFAESDRDTASNRIKRDGPDQVPTAPKVATWFTAPESVVLYSQFRRRQSALAGYAQDVTENEDLHQRVAYCSSSCASHESIQGNGTLRR